MLTDAQSGSLRFYTHSPQLRSSTCCRVRTCGLSKHLFPLQSSGASVSQRRLIIQLKERVGFRDNVSSATTHTLALGPGWKASGPLLRFQTGLLINKNKSTIQKCHYLYDDVNFLTVANRKDLDVTVLAAKAFSYLASTLVLCVVTVCYCWQGL